MTLDVGAGVTDTIGDVQCTNMAIFDAVCFIPTLH